MLRGDISNISAPTIAFRIEDTLVGFREPKNLLEKVLPNNFRLGLNSYPYRVAKFIYNKTEFNIALVCGKDFYNKNSKKLKDLLRLLPIENVVLVNEAHEVAICLNEEEFDYYVDLNLERVSLVNHRRVYTDFDTLKYHLNI